jgi:hypothetical protein
MRLVTYRGTIESAARLGAVDSDMVVDVETIGAKAGFSLPAAMLDFIDLGPAGLAGLRDALDEYRGRWPAGAAVPRSRSASSRGQVASRIPQPISWRAASSWSILCRRRMPRP